MTDNLGHEADGDCPPGCPCDAPHAASRTRWCHLCRHWCDPTCFDVVCASLNPRKLRAVRDGLLALLAKAEREREKLAAEWGLERIRAERAEKERDALVKIGTMRARSVLLAENAALRERAERTEERLAEAERERDELKATNGRLRDELIDQHDPFYRTVQRVTERAERAEAALAKAREAVRRHFNVVDASGADQERECNDLYPEQCLARIGEDALADTDPSRP